MSTFGDNLFLEFAVVGRFYPGFHWLCQSPLLSMTLQLTHKPRHQLQLSILAFEGSCSSFILFKVKQLPASLLALILVLLPTFVSAVNSTPPSPRPRCEPPGTWVIQHTQVSAAVIEPLDSLQQYLRLLALDATVACCLTASAELD
jgi:hypothetical protein